MGRGQRSCLGDRMIGGIIERAKLDGTSEREGRT